MVIEKEVRMMMEGVHLALLFDGIKSDLKKALDCCIVMDRSRACSNKLSCMRSNLAKGATWWFAAECLRNLLQSFVTAMIKNLGFSCKIKAHGTLASLYSWFGKRRRNLLGVDQHKWTACQCSHQNITKEKFDKFKEQPEITNQEGVLVNNLQFHQRSKCILCEVFFLASIIVRLCSSCLGIWMSRVHIIS